MLPEVQNSLTLQNLHRAERGATGIEYLVVAAFLLTATVVASLTGIKILSNLYFYFISVVCSPIL